MESVDQPSLENLEKTVSFKMARDELSVLKEQCEQEGVTLSDFVRRSLRTPVPNASDEPLRRELQAGFELRLLTDKAARLVNDLTDTRQALVVEREKRKKQKRRLVDAEAALLGLQSEDSSGLGGLNELVTKNPAISEFVGNVLLRMAESPKVQKTIGTLMGVSETEDGLDASDKELLTFGRELRRELSIEELGNVFEICYVLIGKKPLIALVLKNLQASLAKKQPSPAPSASAPAPAA